MSTIDAIELKNRIQQVVQQKNLSAQCVAERDTTKVMTVCLGVCIVLLSAATALVYWHKHVSPLTISGIFYSQKEAPVLSFETITKNKIDDLELKVWLLAVAHNQNAHLNQLVFYNHKIADPGYIFFDRDLNLNKMPPTLILNEREKQLLQNHVR